MSTASLTMATDAQIVRALAGQGLPSIDAEARDPMWTVAPTTDWSANLVAAYWLATAARINQYRQRPSTLLVSAAKSYNVQAGMGWNPVAIVTGSGSGTGRIIPTLQTAGALCAGQGVNEVAAILRQLGQPTMIARSVAAQPPGLVQQMVNGVLAPITGASDSFKRQLAFGTAGLFTLAAVGLLGVGLYFFGPSAATVGSASSAAYGAWQARRPRKAARRNGHRRGHRRRR